MANFVKPGDQFVSNDGVTLVVVDRFHKNQQKGFWVSGMREDEVRDITGSQDWAYTGWFIKDYQPGGWPTATDLLCLCPKDELDPPETNEFGLVVP